MLPWVYNADAGGNTSRNDRTNSGYANDICNSEGYLKDYYQQYENDQKKMYDMQMDALKKKQANKNSRSRSGSRNRQRSRSRSRGRYRSRSRDRRRSRSRERRYRGRSRTRSRSRSPRRYGRRSRSRSPCRDSAPVPPSNKLALMNLPKDITRDLIASILASTGFHPMDIRVIHKNSERGAARSFGFIDFPDVATAIRWMDTTKGRLTLPDGRWISVHYSKPETTVPGGRPSGDWICASCTVMNFVKRDVCHKCDTSRTQSDEMERQGVHMIGVSPCDTLLIRDLPHAVTTTDIFNGLVKNTPLKSIIQLQLSESKLFAYIQMKSIDEATVLFDSSYKAPIQVLDKNVIMTYCRVPLSHMMRGNQTSGYDPKLAVDWTSAQTSSSGAEVAAAAMMRVHQRQTPSSQATPQNLYVPSTGAMTYPPPVVNSNYSVPPPTVSYGFGIDTSVPPPTAAKAAQQPPPPVKNGIVGIVPTPRGVMPQYVIPNPSTFQYEPTTGYFLDPITHFYYDAKTTYYYNSDTRQWMYYDSTYSTYFQAQEEESTAPAAENVVQDIIKPDDPKLDDSKKSASDIAKEMHKWAKKQEKQKLQITMKPLVKPLETKSAFDSMASCSTSGADPATILDKSKNPLGSMSDDSDEDDSYKKQSSNEKMEVPPPMNVGISGSYVEPTRQRALPSAEEQREMMERALIDEAKKMCLLCKRAFPSVDVLRKHVEKSDLHKKNLDEKRVEWGQQYMASIKSMGEEKLHVPEPAPKMVYRDRAKERRKQFGIDGGYGRDVTPGATKTEEEIRKESEEAIRRPIDSSNIGNKLLKNMGWKEGQGAGKFGQGIVNPIEAERRVEGAGLGSSGSRIAHGAEASHRERVRASFFNRYKEMQ